MTTRREATIEDLARTEGKAELVNGELILMSAAGGRHGYAIREIVASLRDHERRTGTGHALGDNIGFIVNLPNRRSFCPDAAFYTGTLQNGFLDGAPVLAIEIRSKEHYGPAVKLAAKRADYFAAGTLVVWDVDIRRGLSVSVFRSTAPDRPTIYRSGDHAEAEPAVPGWTMPVDDLIPRDAI